MLTNTGEIYSKNIINEDTLSTNTITSDNTYINIEKGISTKKYLSLGNNNYNITTDGGLCIGNFAAQPYNDGVFKIGIGIDNNHRKTGLLFDNNGVLTVNDKIITNDLQSKNGNNIIKIYNNSIEVSKDGGTDWTGLIKSGTKNNSVCLCYPLNTSSGDDSLAVNAQTIASGNQSFASGYQSKATGHFSHAEGNNSTASGESSHAEGRGETTASGLGSHAEGGGTKSTYNYSHSEGVYTTASGEGAHAEGYTFYNNRDDINIKTWATHKGSHAEGYETQAKNEAAHSEGYRTKATGLRSHAEGENTLTGKIIGGAGTSDNPYVYSGGTNSHAEGYNTQTIGAQSHAGGEGTVADKDNMTAIGQYNIYDATNPSRNENKLFVVGNGTADNARSDAFVVYKNGNVELSGNLTLTNNTKQIQIGSFTIKSSNNGNTLTIQ